VDGRGAGGDWSGGRRPHVMAEINVQTSGLDDRFPAGVVVQDLADLEDKLVVLQVTLDKVASRVVTESKRAKL
jgi:hypothetical protein